MPIRDGMASLITQLRGMTDAGTADYTVAGSPYWTDEQLQDKLDDQRRTRRREPLAFTVDAISGGSAEYHDYYFRHAHVEEAGSGTVAWVLEDSTGADVGTADYEVNYRARHIRFSANTLGTAYYLSYRAYDLNRAAAAVWQDKAAHVAARFDLKIDNHDLKRSQLRDAYLKMAAEYRGKAGGRSIERVRGDANP